ncbi:MULTISPECIES: PTS mannose/fructose/sorbose/N-acetylgalactosamine transporter subunit IIC [Helcococcus]|uniref:PTS sugar transporter subunit IIC n=1 Tax=Helcococcus bovis TaxID=3153252 RepID=A0ABW9F525_9FIRM
MSLTVQALILGLIAAFGTFDYQMGTLYIFRPITLGPLVGLLFNDLHTGLVVGANLELFFMGAVSIGGYLPPDVIVGGVLGTAFAISTKQGAEVALALAMPIALLSLAIGNLFDIIGIFSLRWADKGAKEANITKIRWTHRFIGFLTIFRRFILVFLAYRLGVDSMKVVLESVPQFVITGLGAAAGLLPALGFAMLMKMVIKKELIPFFFIGFVFSAFLNMSTLGIAILGVCYVLVTFGFLKNNPKQSVVSSTKSNEILQEEEDDDF